MSTPPQDPGRFPGEDRVRRAFGRLRSDAARAVDAGEGLAAIEKRSRPWVRAAVPALSAATLLVVVIGLVALLRDGGPEVTGPATSITTTTLHPAPSTTEPPVTTTEPPVTTTEPPVTTTTVPVTTTTTEIPTTTVPPAPVTVGYRVTGVASGDVLNVRAGPGVGHPVVGTLASDAVGVVTTGLATPGVPGGAWWEVELSDGTLGWVNAGFLALSDEWTAPFAEYPCFGGPSEPPTGPSNADHIFALDYLRNNDCERLVIVLGSDGGWHLDPPWPQTPAATVPAGGGGAVASPTPGTVGNSSTVVVPGFLRVVERVRPTATEADFGGPMAFVVRRGAGPLDVKVHFAGNVLVDTFYLSNPARIVVDITDAPTTPGHDYRPLIGPGMIVTAPTDVTGEGAPIALPIAVTGYGRPFEATGYAELRAAGATPGSGELVEARFSCDFADGVGSSCAFMTTDYLEAWGAFGFEIDELAPGDYELFIGELSAENGEPIGVYHRFTITP